MSEVTQRSLPDWQSELKIAMFKYHVLIAWVAVFLNPVWAIADYYTVPTHFLSFFVFRIVVAITILLGIIFKHKLVNRPEIIAFIPFIGIAVQNAYMYSVMDVAELQKHTFAYITLFIGAGMFVLWRSIYSISIVVVTFIANIFFFWINSTLSLNEILINGGLLTASVALFTILLINTRTNLTKKEIIARLALAESNKKLAIQNEIIEEKNKDIRDSINYAQRIQQAILPPIKKIDEALNDYFILYKPKDVVSGDFYWMELINQQSQTHNWEAKDKNAGLANNNSGSELLLVAAADCTGHGVPGALMSIIGNTILNQTATNTAIHTPAAALAFLNKEITKTLNSIKDGMDISFCAIDLKKMELQYAGANNPLYIVRQQELIEIKADKKAIGADVENAEIKTFTNHVLQIKKGDAVYMFTDGYADQFGGPNGKKFKYRKFQELLLEIQHLPMKEQEQLLNDHHEKWKGNLEQVDDILVIGIRIP